MTRRGRRRWGRRSGTRKLRSLGCLTRGKLRLGPPSSRCRLACLFGRDQLSKVTVDSRQGVALNGHGTLDVCPIALQRTGRGARGRLCARVPLTSPGQVVARGSEVVDRSSLAGGGDTEVVLPQWQVGAAASGQLLEQRRAAAVDVGVHGIATEAGLRAAEPRAGRGLVLFTSRDGRVGVVDLEPRSVVLLVEDADSLTLCIELRLDTGGLPSLVVERAAACRRGAQWKADQGDSNEHAEPRLP